MALDPNIPLQAGQAGVLNLSDMARQAQERRYRDSQINDMEIRRKAEESRRGALADLIKQRAPGRVISEGPAFDRYIDADPDNAYKMLEGMDRQKREQVKEGVKDLAAAVQWADTPEKWAQVQQHYSQFDPQLAQTPFEAREQSLLKLGQMGEYLKATEPKIITPQPGGGAFSYSRQGGLQTVIAPNDGSKTMGAPVGAPAGSGAPPSAAIEHLRQNPQLRGAFDAKYGPGSAARVLGGGGGNSTGTFRPVGMPGETVTSTRRSVAHNKRVGGVENSYHLSGRARDSVPPKGMSMAEYHRQLKALNPHLDVINEGDHVHMEPR